MALKPATHWTKTLNITKQWFHAKMKAQGVAPADHIGQIALWDVAEVDAAFKRSPVLNNRPKPVGQAKRKARPKRNGPRKK